MEEQILAALASTPDRDPFAAAVIAFAGSCREAHPTLAVSDAVLAAHLARQFPDLADNPHVLDDVRAGDLYLACAACADVPGAHAQLEAVVTPAARNQLASMRCDPPMIDEVIQLVRHRLLVGGPRSAPALHAYAGLGDLSTFAAVIAARLAIDRIRERKREPELVDSDRLDDEQLARGSGWGDGPEAALVKAEHRALVKQAFADSVAALTARERAILRLHYIDGLGIDEIARLYAAHRASAARWIQAARASLIAGARTRLGETLGEDLNSTMMLVESQMDLSLSRLLRS